MFGRLKERYFVLEKTNPRVLGLLFALTNTFVAAQAFFSASKCKSIDGMTLGYYRGFQNILLAVGFIWYKNGQSFPLENRRTKVLIIRMFFAGISTNLKFTGAKINSLQKFIVIIRSESILTLVFSIQFLGEAFSATKAFSCLLCFFGIVLIVDPSILYQGYMTNEEMTLIGFMFAFFGAFFTSCTRLFIGTNVKDFDSDQNILWSGFSIAIAGALINMSYGEFKYPILSEVPWVIICALMGMQNQVFLLLALRQEKASVVSIIGNLSVVNIFLLDVFVEGNKCYLINLLGACCVICGSVQVAFKPVVKGAFDEEIEDIKNRKASDRTDLKLQKLLSDHASQKSYQHGLHHI